MLFYSNRKARPFSISDVPIYSSIFNLLQDLPVTVYKSLFFNNSSTILMTAYILCGFPAFCLLLKLANKFFSLYIFVLVLWFYLVLYVFYCPKSIGCTERCYQFVIKSLLSVKDSRDILISVGHTIDLYILVACLIYNHIVFPYRIFIVCPKVGSFGKI